MKILEILQPCSDGVGRHVIDLTEGLVLRGHDVTLVYSSLQLDKYFQEGLVRLERLGVCIVDGEFKREIGLADIAACVKLRRLIRSRGGFDIVHAHSSKAGGLSRLPGVASQQRLVYSPHAFVTMDPLLPILKRTVYRLIESMLARWTTCLIATSTLEYQHAQRLGYRKSRISTLHHGVRYQPGVQDNRRQAFRTNLNIDPNDIVLGFVGRFVPQKSPELAAQIAVRVCNKYNNVKVVLVGDGPEYENVKACIAEHKDRILMPGYMDVRDAMAGFDCFMLTSRYEGFPYVLIDAVMAGKPIVSTMIGGADAVIEDRVNGVITKNDEDFFKAVDDLLSSPSRLRQMHNAALQKAGLFTWEKMIDNTERIYFDVSAGLCS